MSSTPGASTSASVPPKAKKIDKSRKSKSSGSKLEKKKEVTDELATLDRLVAEYVCNGIAFPC